MSVFMWVEPMQEEDQPAHLVRHMGVTIVIVDPRADRLDLLQFLVDELLIAEQDEFRAAFDWPLVGEGPVPDSWVDDPASITTPRALLLPKHRD